MRGTWQSKIGVKNGASTCERTARNGGQSCASASSRSYRITSAPVGADDVETGERAHRLERLHSPSTSCSTTLAPTLLSDVGWPFPRLPDRVKSGKRTALDAMKEPTFALPPALVNLIGEIEEFKGR